jgi:hypothetical protein
MTEPTQDAPATEESTTEGSPDVVTEVTILEQNDLPEDTPSFVVDKAVNPTQLTEALTAAGATSVVIQLAEGLDSPFDASADSPVVVYVEGLTKKKVNDAIAAHEAETDFGQTDEQKAQAAAIAKVQDPQAEVTLADLKTALAALLAPAQPAEIGASA